MGPVKSITLPSIDCIRRFAFVVKLLSIIEARPATAPKAVKVRT